MSPGRSYIVILHYHLTILQINSVLYVTRSCTKRDGNVMLHNVKLNVFSMLKYLHSHLYIIIPYNKKASCAFKCRNAYLIIKNLKNFFWCFNYKQVWHNLIVMNHDQKLQFENPLLLAFTVFMDIHVSSSCNLRKSIFLDHSIIPSSNFFKVCTALIPFLTSLLASETLPQDAGRGGERVIEATSI